MADIFSKINRVNLVYPQKQLTDFVASTFLNKKEKNFEKLVYFPIRLVVILTNVIFQ